MSELDRLREHLTTALHAHHPAPPEPIRNQDEPLLRTCLRRALRRKEAGYAFAAASALMDCDPRKLWKEIAAIALKDFALADLPLFGSIIAAASSKSWRDKNGGDWHIASHLLLGLLNTPCDRRLRKLQLAARNGHADAHKTLGSVIADAAKVISRCERRVPYPALVAISANECDNALEEMGVHHALDESLIVIRFRDPKKINVDFQYLLSMIHDSFMSRRNTLVVPGGKMAFAIEIIMQPLIESMVTTGVVRYR